MKSIKQWFGICQNCIDRLFEIVDDPRYYYPLEAGNVVLSMVAIALAFSEHDVRTAITVILINSWGLAKACKETRARFFEDLATACHRQIAILDGWCTKCVIKNLTKFTKATSLRRSQLIAGLQETRRS